MPVLGSSEVAAYFDDAVDYGAFALAGVPKAALPTLHLELAAVSSARLQQMHASLLQHRRLFLWGSGGFAFNVTMHELCWRARYRRPRVRCEALLPSAAASLVIPPPQRRSSKASRGSPGGSGGSGSRTAWWRRASCGGGKGDAPCYNKGKG